MTIRKAGWWLVRGGWAVCALVLAWLVLFSGIDPGSRVLFALAIPGVAVALLCVGYAIEARDLRARFVWIGRGLALLGAAFAVSFPAQLYQEILMVQARGQTPADWYPRAIWYSAATMPLILVPALVALRWPRLGAVLFVISGSLQITESVYQPFGVIFPESTGSGWTGVPVIDVIVQPAFVAAALLFLGSTGPESKRLSGSMLSPASGS